MIHTDPDPKTPKKRWRDNYVVSMRRRHTHVHTRSDNATRSPCAISHAHIFVLTPTHVNTPTQNLQAVPGKVASSLSASLSSSTRSPSIGTESRQSAGCPVSVSAWCMQFNEGRKRCVNTAVGWLRHIQQLSVTARLWTALHLCSDISRK